MSQDGLYDYFVHLDCLPREVDEDQESAFEAALRERLQVPIGEDLLHAALAEEWNRRFLKLHPLAL